MKSPLLSTASSTQVTAAAPRSRRPDSAAAGDFQPLMDYMVQQQRQATALQGIADANRRALSNERVTEQDLQRADEKLARRAAQARDPGQLRRQDSIDAARQGLSAVVEPGGLAAGRAMRSSRRAGPSAAPSNPPPAGLPRGADDAPRSSGQQPGGPAGSRGRAPVDGGAGRDAARPGNTALPGPLSATGRAVARGAAAASAGGPVQSTAQAGRSGGDSGANANAGAQGGAAPRKPQGPGPRSAFQSPETRNLTPAARRSTLSDVLRVLRTRNDSRRSQVKLQLNPPELGRLTIDMRLQRQTMQIRIVAESGAVRDLLQGHESFLVEALQDQGLSVQRFEVQLQTEEHGPEFGQHDSAHDRPDDRAAAQAADPGHEEDGETSAGDELAAVLEAELPAHLFIPGRVDITA